MLQALPIRSALTQIYLTKRPYVSDDQPTPNQMVERKSFFRQMRKLRKAEELLSKPLYEMRGETAGEDEDAPEINTLRTTNYRTQDPKSALSETKPSPIRNNPEKDDSPQAEQEYLPPVLAEQLPLFLERELISLLDDARLGQAERVLEYLARAESREIDPWVRDDYRVAWLTVLYAARDFVEPWNYAFASYYGKHPSKAIPIWLKRDAERDRLLGPGLTDDSVIYPPKKPVQRVTSLPQKKAGEM